jgi:hypothetical protein
MRFTPPSDQNLEEKLQEYSARWNAEFEQKFEKWKKLTEEQRIAVAKKILDHFNQLAKENPQLAAIEFYKWLSSPDGAIVWPFLFRKEYRGIIVDITRHILEIVHRTIALNMLKEGGQ